MGGGPAGLIAAEVVASGGWEVTLVEHMPSVGRKFLLAGRGGLNITHSEPLDDLVGRYGSVDGHGAIVQRRLADAIARFTPSDLRTWSASLGQPTFVGSSGRVFPEAFRATPLLRAWLARLESLGVELRVRHRWLGWETSLGRADPTRVLVRGPTGAVEVLAAPAVVLALGGASWPRVGSDGEWASVLRDAGVNVTTLAAANCGYRVDWSPTWSERFAGVPLKNVSGTVAGHTARGEAMITAAGIEGGLIYALGAAIRDELGRTGECYVVIDLHPDLEPSDVVSRLATRRPKDSLSNWLRRSLGLAPVAIGLLREVMATHLPKDAQGVAALVKALPIRLIGPMPIERAISTAGGVTFGELDDSFMLRSLPGVFVAGEMLDWDAPTGGYLLQASFSTGVAAARGALAWLDGQR